MIEYLILLLLMKYRHGVVPQRDPLDDCLEIGAGLDFNPPERERPNLRIVK